MIKKWIINVSLICTFFLISCNQRVTITRSYIYDVEWKKGNYQGFKISKIILKDSTVSIYDENFTASDLNNHTLDSSKCFREVSIDNPHTGKIYFDKESDGTIWAKCWDSSDKRKRIGLLDLEAWYVVKGLGKDRTYYVYIDNKGDSHLFVYGPTNW